MPEYIDQQPFSRNECHDGAAAVAPDYMTWLDEINIEYKKRGFATHIGNFAYKYQLKENDFRKILEVLKEMNLARLGDEDSFWRYLNSVCQNPPIEPEAHLIWRGGTNPFSKRKWYFLSMLVRDPRNAERSPSTELIGYIAEDDDYAEVYEYYLNEAVGRLEDGDNIGRKKEDGMFMGQKIDENTFWSIDFDTLIEEYGGSTE